MQKKVNTKLVLPTLTEETKENFLEKELILTNDKYPAIGFKDFQALKKNNPEIENNSFYFSSLSSQESYTDENTGTKYVGTQEIILKAEENKNRKGSKFILYDKTPPQRDLSFLLHTSALESKYYRNENNNEFMWILSHNTSPNSVSLTGTFNFYSGETQEENTRVLTEKELQEKGFLQTLSYSNSYSLDSFVFNEDSKKSTKIKTYIEDVLEWTPVTYSYDGYPKYVAHIGDLTQEGLLCLRSIFCTETDLTLSEQEKKELSEAMVYAWYDSYGEGYTPIEDSVVLQKKDNDGKVISEKIILKYWSPQDKEYKLTSANQTKIDLLIKEGYQIIEATHTGSEVSNTIKDKIENAFESNPSHYRELVNQYINSSLSKKLNFLFYYIDVESIATSGITEENIKSFYAYPTGGNGIFQYLNEDTDIKNKKIFISTNKEDLLPFNSKLKPHTFGGINCQGLWSAEETRPIGVTFTGNQYEDYSFEEKNILNFENKKISTPISWIQTVGNYSRYKIKFSKLNYGELILSSPYSPELALIMDSKGSISFVVTDWQKNTENNRYESKIEGLTLGEEYTVILFYEEYNQPVESTPNTGSDTQA